MSCDTVSKSRERLKEHQGATSELAVVRREIQTAERLLAQLRAQETALERAANRLFRELASG